MATRRSGRRVVLASLAAAMLAAPAIGTGCGGGFAPISEIDGLRVLAVVADKPYAQPGDTVTFTMTVDDGLADPDAGPRPREIVWIGGCFDPPADEYYGCYAQLGKTLVDPTSAVASGLVGLGDTFQLELPADIISRRPMPSAGTPYYGIAYVFFAVCAGHIQAVPPQGTGLAGSFPIGCFDDAGQQLGADSFVPGYASVYAFADGRTNADPVILGFDVTPTSGADAGAGDSGDDASTDGGVPSETVAPCSISEGDRVGAGCGHKDPFNVCSPYRVAVEVPPDVAELDPASHDASGKELREVVWVDYFADQGDVKDPVLLVSDAQLGIQADFSTQWLPPPASGTAHLYAVVHDSRGGQSVIEKTITVTSP